MKHAHTYTHIRTVVPRDHSQVPRDHNFPQNAEFLAKLQNLPISSEFLCFRSFALLGNGCW